jgi:hypothetical protein
MRTKRVTTALLLVFAVLTTIVSCKPLELMKPLSIVFAGEEPLIDTTAVPESLATDKSMFYTSTPIGEPTVIASNTATATPTVTKTLTPSPTELVSKPPIVVQVNMDTCLYYEVDVVGLTEEIIGLADAYNYEIVTAYRINETNRPVVLVIEQLTRSSGLGSTFMELSEVLISHDIPAVVGFAAGPGSIPTNDIHYLKYLVDDHGWQIANNGYSYFNFLPSDSVTFYDVTEDIFLASRRLRSLFDNNYPSVLVIPQGKGQENPEVYKAAESVEIVYVIGPEACMICEEIQSVQYLQSLLYCREDTLGNYDLLQIVEEKMRD